MQAAFDIKINRLEEIHCLETFHKTRFVAVSYEPLGDIFIDIARTQRSTNTRGCAFSIISGEFQSEEHITELKNGSCSISILGYKFIPDSNAFANEISAVFKSERIDNLFGENDMKENPFSKLYWDDNFHFNIEIVDLYGFRNLHNLNLYSTAPQSSSIIVGKVDLTIALFSFLPRRAISISSIPCKLCEIPPGPPKMPETTAER